MQPWAREVSRNPLQTYKAASFMSPLMTRHDLAIRVISQLTDLENIWIIVI